MRLRHFVLAALAPAAAAAQYPPGNSGYARLDCADTYEPGCYRPEPGCYRPCPPAPTEEDRGGPGPEADEGGGPRGLGVGALPGAFAVPQAAGEQIGESGSVGIRGLELRLPEMRLALPEIRLPSYYRIRHGAEMRVAESRAPFVLGQAATYGMMSPGGTPELDQLAVSLPARRRPTTEEDQEEDQEEDRDEDQEDTTRKQKCVPPCPPPYHYQPPYTPPCHDLGPEECAPAAGAYHGYYGQPAGQPNTYPYSPYSTAPVPDATREAAVPPPPAPPADPTVSELQRLRQQMALQQQAMMELQKSMERTQQGLNAALGPAPAARMAGRPSAPPQPLEEAEQPGSRIRPVPFQQVDDGWLAPEEVESVARSIWRE